MNSNRLRTLQIRPIPPQKAEQYPFNIPAIQGNTQIEFSASVTFLVGENGSGKSTLLEAIAAEIGAYPLYL